MLRSTHSVMLRHKHTVTLCYELTSLSRCDAVLLELCDAVLLMRGAPSACRGLAHGPRRTRGPHSPGDTGPWWCWACWHRADRGCFCPYVGAQGRGGALLPLCTAV